MSARRCGTCGKSPCTFRGPKRHKVHGDRHTHECRKCWKASLDRFHALRMALSCILASAT
jgi:hypothetical protein